MKKWKYHTKLICTFLLPMKQIQGGSKHDGIAAVLRIRHGASTVLSTSSTLQSADGKDDLIDVTFRRTMPSRKSSEVAAIALGIKRALHNIPPSCRKQVLILSDSEYALDFFCNASAVRRVVNKRKKRKGTASMTRGKGKITQSMEVREEAHRRSLLSLMEETPNVVFAKVRSSSRGVGISANNGTGIDNAEAKTEAPTDKVDSTSWDGIGLIDHDAADYLSSITRSVANNYDEETFGFCEAKPLGQHALAWLQNSEHDQTITTNKNDGKGPSESRSSSFWKTIKVVGSEARDDRQRRNRCRTEIIQEMLEPIVKIDLSM